MKFKQLLIKQISAACFAALFASNAFAQILPRMPNGPMSHNNDNAQNPLKVPTIGELNEAMNYYHSGNYAEALKIAQGLSNRGDGNSAALVGFIYENGFWVKQIFKML